MITDYGFTRSAIFKTGAPKSKIESTEGSEVRGFGSLPEGPPTPEPPKRAFVDRWSAEMYAAMKRTS